MHRFEEQMVAILQKYVTEKDNPMPKCLGISFAFFLPLTPNGLTVDKFLTSLTFTDSLKKRQRNN